MGSDGASIGNREGELSDVRGASGGSAGLLMWPSREQRLPWVIMTQR